MPVQKINIGAAPNDKTGDSLREAFALTNAAIDQVNKNTDTIEGKVDKASGMGLSQNSFTNEQRDKLNGLEGTHWRGTFLSVSALQAALPTANAGDCADVDVGAGSDVQRYIWDASDTKWVPQQSATSLTAAQVKTLYESNPDTNAYTNAEKAELTAIQEALDRKVDAQPNAGLMTDAEKKLLGNSPQPTNLFYNGKFLVSQLGIGPVAIAPGAFSWSVDGVRHVKYNTANTRWQQGTNSAADIAVSGSSKALLIEVTAPATTLAADHYEVFDLALEGYETQKLIGKTFTVGAMVYSSVPGTYCIAVNHPGTTYSYVTEIVIPVARQWTFVTFTVPGGLPAAYNWPTNNQAGVRFFFCLACGASLQTPSENTWLSGNFHATPNQVNLLVALENTFAIADFSVCVGDVYREPAPRMAQEEFLLCQRYVRYATVSALGPTVQAGQSIGATVPLMPPMRTAPSAVFVSDDIWGPLNLSGAVSVLTTSDTLGAYAATTAAQHTQFSKRYLLRAHL